MKLKARLQARTLADPRDGVRAAVKLIQESWSGAQLEWHFKGNSSNSVLIFRENLGIKKKNKWSKRKKNPGSSIIFPLQGAMCKD